ncbi:MAG: hypothetical protein ACQESA_02425 [Patescibacteria group bacterium]
MKVSLCLSIITLLSVLSASSSFSAKEKSTLAWITAKKIEGVVLFRAHCKNPEDKIVTYKYEFSTTRIDDRGDTDNSTLTGSIKLQPREHRIISSLIISIPIKDISLSLFKDNEKIAEAKPSFK